MTSLRLAVAAALAVLVSASPGAESRECAELGGCAVAPEGGAADHLLFQARAKMHKADTSAAEEGGEIHKSYKSHKSAVEDSVSLEPVCQIKEKRPTAEARSYTSPQGRPMEWGRGNFLSDGYGIVGNVATAERCTQNNCNIDQSYVLFAADLFTPVHTEGEEYKPGLCACMRKGTEKTLIKWETKSWGGHHKDNCHAQQCWYEYATAVYATEVKDWVNDWERHKIRNLAVQAGWDVGCVTITDQENPIEQENLMTVEGMLDKVGEHRKGTLCEGVGITRGKKGASQWDGPLHCLSRKRVWDDMKGLIPGLEIQEKQPEMAPSEPEAPVEPEPGAPEELCARMGTVVSKIEECGQMIANEMNHVSDVQQNKNTKHEQFLGSAMEVLEAAVTDESHDRTFNDVLKELTILKEREHWTRSLKYTDLDSDMVKFTASRTKAKEDLRKLRGDVEALPKDNYKKLQESLDPVMVDLSKVMHDVLEGASVMSNAKRALTCP